MRIDINPKYVEHIEFFKELPKRFNSLGKSFFKERNEIKIIKEQGIQFNVKSFKTPHLVNRIAYAYLRGSKAKRSFLNGMKLTELDVPTPEPAAYVETFRKGLLDQSFYVSIHHNYKFTIRDLIGFEFPDKENILRQFTRFTYEKLHCNGVHHLDYSRGNILITKNDKKYDFSIVDINRMLFRKMDYFSGLRNFSQIWANKEELEIVAREYALLHGENEERATKLLIQFDKRHKRKINRKIYLKKTIKKIILFN